MKPFCLTLKKAKEINLVRKMIQFILSFIKHSQKRFILNKL